MRSDNPVLVVEDVQKWYGGVHALRDVNLELHRGEILALVGDNGAGKSTLMKTLAGNIRPDRGRIIVDDEERDFRRPSDATAAGISTVYQDLALALDLDIAENIFLGRELRVSDQPRRMLGHLDRRRMIAEAREALDRVRIRIPDITTRCVNLSGGQRQAVAIARAVMWCEHVLLLDEPTAALGVEQQQEVLDLIVDIRDRLGIAVVLVSHQLPHVLEVADRVAVLRQGAVTHVFSRDEITTQRLVAAITGLEEAA